MVVRITTVIHTMQHNAYWGLWDPAKAVMTSRLHRSAVTCEHLHEYRFFKRILFQEIGSYSQRSRLHSLVIPASYLKQVYRAPECCKWPGIRGHYTQTLKRRPDRTTGPNKTSRWALRVRLEELLLHKKTALFAYCQLLYYVLFQRFPV